MSNIVKGVVMNNKYLLLYKEYMRNNMFQLTNSNNRVRANVCDDCDGSCVSGGGERSGRGCISRSGRKYRQVNIFHNALEILRPNALALPRPSSLVVVKSIAQPLCSNLCSNNIHNDCICL